MKKRIVFSTVIALLALTAGGFGPSAWADSTNGALIVRNYSCGMIDGLGTYKNVSTTDSKVVLSNNANGNVTVICKGDVTPSLKGTVHWDHQSIPLLCGTEFSDLTYDWQEVVSPKGHATLICHINHVNPGVTL